MTGAARAVVSDFGGVLTSPLLDAFGAVQQQDGVPLEALGQAMAIAAARAGEPPLFRLERGEMTEAEFLRTLEGGLRETLGREVSLDGFTETWFGALHPNEELFGYYRTLHARGVRLAICTNNVREWEARWRTLLPIDEIFDVVVDSAFVGARKPERRIYEITLERLGVRAAETVFVDDIEANVVAARELGMHGVLFASNEQAIAEIDAALAG